MATHRTQLTGKAEIDLDLIDSYLREHSDQIADDIIRCILSAIRSLQNMPQRNVQVGVSRKQSLPVHRLVVEPYLIFYRVEPNVVYILTIRHAARRPLKRFD